MYDSLPIAIEKGALIICESSWFADVVKVLTGAILTAIPAWFIRSRKIRSCKSSLQAELEKCKSMAETYLSNISPATPSYRMPIFAWTSAYPALMGISNLTQDQTTALISIYIEIDSFNRGLDQVQEARFLERGSAEAIQAEVNRNKTKCENVLSQYSLALSSLSSIKNWF